MEHFLHLSFLHDLHVLSFSAACLSVGFASCLLVMRTLARESPQWGRRPSVGGVCCSVSCSCPSLLICCSITQLCLILQHPMDCNTPGFPVPHHLLELVHIHVRCISDAIQPPHPLPLPSPPAFNLSQHHKSWGNRTD